MNRLAQDFKPPGEMPRRTMPLLVLLSGAGMGPLVAFFACRGMNLYAHTLGRVSKCGAQGLRRKSPHACLLGHAQQKGELLPLLEKDRDVSWTTFPLRWSISASRFARWQDQIPDHRLFAASTAGGPSIPAAYRTPKLY